MDSWDLSYYPINHLQAFCKGLVLKLCRTKMQKQDTHIILSIRQHTKLPEFDYANLLAQLVRHLERSHQNHTQPQKAPDQCIVCQLAEYVLAPSIISRL